MEKDGATKEDGKGEILDARIHDMIGRALEDHYKDLVRAPMPDKFLVLLAQLEAKERSGS